ncbi:MAG: efflux RND transporter permease subunit [Verrucomicrobia bacterium]|nr:MAG: efflux RND transporter permease subunit [Verrucomicrobiota bacterium]
MKDRLPERTFTTSRPVAVLMVFTAAVVFGFFSFKRLPVTLMPDLTYPTLTVRTEYPGAAPQEVENEISRPLEEALGVIGGLNKISSISRAGVSDVVLEFVWGTDMSEAVQETLEKLDLVFLPREAERPLILRFDPSLDPIMELSLSGEGPLYRGEAGLRRLRRLAELVIKRQLEPIPGVAAVRVRGGLEEEYHVLLNEAALVRVGLSVQQVIDRLRQENINVAGGTLQEGRAEYMVRTLNEFTTLEDIGNTIVTRHEGRDVRIRDIARVVRAQKDREMITRTDGRESVQIDIYKEADANIVAVARAVRLAIEGQPMPPGMPGAQAGPEGPMRSRAEGLAARLWKEESARLAVVADRSRFIESSIREVRNTAILGGVLAILVLYLFLGDGRTTAIIGVSIPMSLLITFAPMNLLGISLNIMSLGGLALGVGMLVDNSIVVLESIYRCREEGDDLIRAAIRGTREVRGAVIASTLTTVAVFFPLVFVEGIAGQAFGDLGIAVVTSLLASLLVAVGFIPMVASRSGFRAEPGESVATDGGAGGWASWRIFRETWTGVRRPWHRILLPWWIVRLAVGSVLELAGRLLVAVVGGLIWLAVRGVGPWLVRGVRVAMAPLAALTRGLLRGLQSGYPRLMSFTLDRPLGLLLLVAVCGGLAVLAATRLGYELLPEVHQGEFTFETSLPVGTPIERTEAVMSRVEQAILADREDIERLLVTFGYDVTNMKRADEGEHSARFKVLVRPGRDPRGTEERVLARLRRYFAQVPDLEVRLTRPVLFSSKAPIVVEIEGDDLAALKRVSDQAASLLRELPELADVEATLRAGAPEIQIEYDRDRLMTYGLNLGAVARQVRDLVKGFEATRFNLKDRRVPVVVRLDESDREHLDDIAAIVVNPGAEQPIPLEAVATLRLGEGPSEIRRIDGQRVALIQASVGRGSLGGAVRRIQEVLGAQIDWPPGMRFVITGQNEEWEKSEGSLYLALGLSLFLVYVIMAAQFESLLHPLIIMVTIPLAFLGSVLGLWALGVSVSIVVFLGLIMLAGIVVNNAIVLVDYANTLRSRGLELREAILTAGRVRLRPILLTTATTVLGLLPMALGLGDGAEIRTPMALTVIFGLVSSTVLTLVIIPTVYYWVGRGKQWLAGRWGAAAEVGKPADALSP